MKTLLLLAAIFCATLLSNAQTNPGAAVQVTNMSGCDYYVSVKPRNTSSVSPACALHQEITVFVPANGGAALIPGFAGVQYEIAYPSYFPPTQGGMPLTIVKPPFGTPTCPALTSAPQCDDWIDNCQGKPAEICWGGTAAAPTLQINN